MKSALIITFQWFNNYGTVLQAYALQTTLESLGVNANILPLQIRESWLRRLLSKTLSGTIEKLNKYIQERGNKWRNGFDAFRKAYFNYGQYKPTSFDDAIKCNYDEKDVLVFGSDNIWSLGCINFDGAMSGVFLGDRIVHRRKVVYAASTAGDITLQEKFAQALERIKRSCFSAISLRERINVKTFSQYGLNAELVPDPTILLTSSQWETIEKKKGRMEKNYVFGYDLGHAGAVGVMQACKKIARAKDCLVAVPYPKFWWRDRDVACYPDPAEWISFLHHSRCVVTNSFHGVVFSLIFHRPFLFIEIEGSGESKSLNMRASEMLHKMNLSNRIFTSAESESTIVERMFEPIDWDAVNAKFVDFRQKGLDFLSRTVGVA